jgi:hypothetical protein
MVIATDTQNFTEKNTEFIVLRNELPPVGSVAIRCLLWFYSVALAIVYD